MAAVTPDPLVSVIGGGAVGGLLAALLARAGRRVELVVREGREVAYRAGLRVATPAGSFRQVVAIRTSPSAEAALVVIAVKLPDLDAACQLVGATWAREEARGARSAPDGAPLALVVQNGLEALDVAQRRLPSGRLAAAVVECGATSLTPGEITYSIPGRLVIGAATPHNAACVERIANLLAPAIPCAVTDDIRGAQRLKFLVNLNNGVAAATGLTIQDLYATGAGVRLSLGVMREGLAALRSGGLAPPRNRRGRLLRLALRLPDPLAIGAFRIARLAMRQRAPVYTSTLQSVLRRRPSEIAWLNGAVVRLGQAHAIPTPLNQVVTQTVQSLESGERVGYATPAALLAGRP